MNNEKLTILYERLSHEDGRENESLSIENQKAYLEEYAVRSGFKNLVHRTDDGWSGTRWDRPGFVKMTEDIEGGNVGQILIKDMSRLGRDHLRVGLFLEQLREMRGTIQGCSYGEKIGTNPNINLEAPFIKTIEKIWEYEKKIDGKINRLVDLRSEINTAIEMMENSEERLLLKYRYLKNESWEDISYELNVSYRTVHRIHASALNNFVVPE